MIAAAVGRAEVAGAAGKAPAAAAPLQSVISAVEGSLGPRYQEAWESCLPGRRGAAAGPCMGASSLVPD
jgi:hypothetical protein